MFQSIFKEKKKYITVSTTVLDNVEDSEQKPNVPSGLWLKCKGCGKILYKKDVEENLLVCTACDYHFRVSAYERIDMIIDKDTFVERDKEFTVVNALNFKGYEDKLEKYSEQSGLNDAVVTGIGKIDDTEVALAVMDSNFMMGSMGSVVGDKITRLIECATANRLPVIIFTTSGGARMQEGIVSLMQMAKVSGALAKHSEQGLLYITVLTDPTTGGVTASFAMLGDIILAEPKALIGFAGQRVIQSTLKQELPQGFQRSEFLLEKGFVDKIVDRRKMKSTLSKLLLMHKGC